VEQGGVDQMTIPCNCATGHLL